MAKIKWKTVEEKTAEQQRVEEKKQQRERFKGKDITKLTTKEKDDLLIQMAKDSGYL